MPAENIIINIGSVIGAIGAIVVAIRKAQQYLAPMKISGGTTLSFDEARPDEILATLVNTTSSPIYLQSCKAREVKSKKRILLERVRLEKSHLYGNRHNDFDVKSYNLLTDVPLKIEPGELVNLNHRLNSNHPLAGFFSREFVIEAILSNGRVVTSKRVQVPHKWLFQVKKMN